MKFFNMFCHLCLIFLVLGAGCAPQHVPTTTQPALSEQKPPIVSSQPPTKSCEEKAWEFDPNRDTPDFSNACAWHSTGSIPIPWLFEMYVEKLKREVSIELGCMRYYVHRYANIAGVEFYVFCNKGAYPDILGWGIKEDESPVGWVAVANEDGSWIPMGWGAVFNVEADVTFKPLQVHWLHILVQSNSALIERIFEREKK